MPRGIRTFLLILLLISTVGIGAWWLRRTFGQNADTKPAVATSRPIPEGGWGPISVMTANVRLDQPSDGDNGWLHRRELLVKTLLKYQPEILGCQELSPAQGAYLRKELAPWYSYYPRAGVGPAAAASQTRSAAAELLGALGETLASLDTLYYRSDRFDIIDGEAGLVLPKEPQANAAENTFFSMAVLQERRAPSKNAPTLLVVDIHFRHGQPFAIRCAQEMHQKLAGWLTQYPHSGILLMGDINQGRNTDLYNTIVAAPPTPPALADSFDYTQLTANTLNGTYQQFIGKPNATWPSDLIFFGGALRLSQAAEILRDHTAEGRYPSDHYFVQAAFKWNP